MALGFYNPHHAEPCIVKGDEEATAPETWRRDSLSLILSCQESMNP